MHVAQTWRMNEQRYSLKGHQCEKCGKVSFREVCPNCTKQEKTPVLTLVAESNSTPVVLQRAAR